MTEDMAGLLGFSAVILAIGVAIALCVHGFNIITIHKHYRVKKEDDN